MKIYCLTQRLPRFEMRQSLRWDGHRITIAWIASHTGSAVHRAETAKSPKLNPVCVRHRIRHCLQNGCHRRLHIMWRQLRKLAGQLLYEVGSIHGPQRINQLSVGPRQGVAQRRHIESKKISPDNRAYFPRRAYTYRVHVLPGQTQIPHWDVPSSQSTRHPRASPCSQSL